MSTTPKPPASVAIGAALPLRVDEVFVTDPVVTLRGQRWSLVVWCPFHVTGLDFDSESGDLEDRVWDLIGYSVRTFSTTSAGPVFGFGEGVDLVLDEGEDGDPWILTIPGDIIDGGTRNPHWS